MGLADPFDNTPPTPISVATTWNNDSPVATSPSLGAGFDNSSPVAATPALGAAFDHTAPDVARVFNNFVLVTRASTGNVNLAATLQSVVIDGEPCNPGDTVLLKNQTAKAENGVYVVVASPGLATRHTPADNQSELAGGLRVEVGAGSSNAGKTFILGTPPPIIIGTTPLEFFEDAAIPRPLA